MADPIAIEALHVAYWTLGCAALTLALSFVAVPIALLAVRRSDLNSSAALLVSIHESYRTAWRNFLDPRKAEERRYHFADLVNLIEINSGLHSQKTLKGVAEELSREYLISILKLMLHNDDFVELINELRDTESTFKYAAKFCQANDLQHLFPGK